MFLASLWLILSLALVILLVVLALRPTLSTIAGLVGQIKQQKELAGQLDDKIRKVQKAKTELEAVRGRLVLLDQGLPEISLWDEFANRLQTLASEQGVELDDMSISDVEISSGATTPNQMDSVLPQEVKRVNFVVNFRGEYSQLKSFIWGVAEMRRLVSIKRVVLTREDEGQIIGVLEGVSGFVTQNTNL
jgi:Tfp pilus assembly protein PilO